MPVGAVDHDGDGPVVVDLDAHIGAKAARGHGQAGLAEEVGDLVEQGLGLPRRGRLGERRAAALAGPRVERELAY